MFKDYEMQKSEILRKGFLSAEDRFFLGVKENRQVLNEIPVESRGAIRCEADIEKVRLMATCKRYSIMEVANMFGITWRIVYCILGLELPGAIKRADEQMTKTGVTVKLLNGKRHYSKRFAPSPEQRREIVAAYESGEATRDLAKKFSTSRQALKHVLVVEGAELRDERNDRLPRAERLGIKECQAIDACWAQGYSPKEIAQRVSVTEVQVRYHLRHNA